MGAGKEEEEGVGWREGVTGWGGPCGMCGFEWERRGMWVVVGSQSRSGADLKYRLRYGPDEKRHHFTADLVPREEFSIIDHHLIYSINLSTAIPQKRRALSISLSRSGPRNHRSSPPTTPQHHSPINPPHLPQTLTILTTFVSTPCISTSNRQFSPKWQSLNPGRDNGQRWP